jgi:catechol-2,3-dioxygenase
MPPNINAVDHIHVYVTNRSAVEAWYKRVLGLTRVQKFDLWASDGPQMLAAPSAKFKIALFERPAENCRSTIAFDVSAKDFVAWRAHLAAELDHTPQLDDHELSWSIYFHDPEGNPYEITTYEYDEATALLKSQQFSQKQEILASNAAAGKKNA